MILVCLREGDSLSKLTLCLSSFHANLSSVDVQVDGLIDSSICVLYNLSHFSDVRGQARLLNLPRIEQMQKDVDYDLT